MKRILTAFLLTAAAVFLVSCNQAEKPTETSEAVSSGQETEAPATAAAMTEAVTETVTESAEKPVETDGSALPKAENFKKDVTVKKEEETEAPAEETGENALPHSKLYDDCLAAYETKEMPDYARMSFVPTEYEVHETYKSVSLTRLQGRWVNEYTDSDGTKVKEILTVNGTHGRIETYLNGEKKGAWNGEGEISIEDRTYRNVCPAFRIMSAEGENICTIYIRWVKDDSFYDGGFTTEWKRESTDTDPWLHDTVTLPNLEGVWYTEKIDGMNLTMDLLTISGTKATLFETKNDEVSPFWNLDGEAEIVRVHSTRTDESVPELLISDSTGETAGAGIYITSVDQDAFYDQGLHRWWVRIKENGYQEYSDAPREENGNTVIPGTRTIVVTPADEEAPHRKWQIRVTGGFGCDATFTPETDPDSNWFPGADSVVLEEDVNFDGLPDLLFFKTAVGTKNTFYMDCWLGVGNTFVKCNNYDTIPDAVPVPDDRVIYGTLSAGPDKYTEYKYRVQGFGAEFLEENTYSVEE